MAKNINIDVPDIGDFDEVPVIEVLVKEGDVVEIDQALIVLESDKSTMEVPASSAGKLKKNLKPRLKRNRKTRRMTGAETPQRTRSSKSPKPRVTPLRRCRP